MSKGQKLLDFKDHDTSAYIYTLDKAQMDFITKRNNIIDTSFLFTHLYKKVALNSNYSASLPYGNYIVATITREMVQYRYINLSSFVISSRVIGNDVVLYLKDKKSRATLSHAQITLNELAVPYSEGYGGYAFDKTKVDAKLLAQYQAFLRVSLNDEYLITHYSINPLNQNYPSRRRLFKGPQSSLSTGYVITDKPVYRPGDTLRLKAFLTDPKTGKPHKRTADFYISEAQQNFRYQKKLKALTPGAFVFEWKIPDTLKIDRNFQLDFVYKVKRRQLRYASSFYLENYVLSTTQFDAFMAKNEFYPNEDIAFRVQATDANDFPLQGTQIHYKLSLTGVQDFFGDSLTLSAAKRNNLYEHDTVYPYEKTLYLKIPSTVLPNMDANYHLEVTMTDPSTFEQKVFQLDCSRLKKVEKLLVYQEQDSLFVRYLYNGRDTANVYQVLSFHNGDTLMNKKITTPFRCQLSPYATLVQVVDKDKNARPLNVNFNALNITKVNGVRSADSIRIQFSFPFEEAIYYRILKKDQVVQQGKTKTLDYRIADQSKDAYTILFTSNINNAIETNFYRITYVPPLHKIKLQTTLPAQAFPGQKLQVQVQATDCYNKPLEKINIAAFAVNKQFNERFVEPVITVPEEYKDLVQMTAEPMTHQVNLPINYFQLQAYLSAKNFARFDLKDNEYYRLRYPEAEYASITKKIQSPLPEFAITVTAKHKTYTPKYIMLDGQLVYISDLHANAYSFQTTASKHQISFRFANKKITLNDVSLEPHTKYWFGFNADSIKPGSKRFQIVDSLTIAQPSEEEKKLLYSSLLLTTPFGYDTLVVRADKEIAFTSHRNFRRQAVILNIDGYNFYVFGPLNTTSTALLHVNKKEFNLRTSTEYAHYFDNRTQEFTTKPRGAVKGAILGFAEEPLQAYHLTSMQVYDTVPPVPVPVQLKFNEEVNRAIKTEQEPAYTQYYYGNGAAYFSLRIKNDDKKRYVKALWLINNREPEQSHFSPIYDRWTLSALDKSGNEGRYDIYLLMNDQKLLVLREHAFKNGDQFFISPLAFETVALTNEQLAAALKVHTDLTKLPLLPFYFPPEETKETIKEIKDAKRQNTYLHGYVTNEALQPLANVMVLAEVNGKFMYGGLTNNVGEYEILNMLPGSYQLKFYNAGFQMKSFATRFFKSGHSYELNTSLKNSNLQRPVLETVEKEFRFMVFNGSPNKNTMKLNVYDKDTREALHNFTVTVNEAMEGTIEKTLITKDEPELAFLPQANVYNVTIACKGYVPVTYYNVRFCKNSFYAFYLFMLNEKDYPLIKKKHYDLQMQNYSATEEIGNNDRDAYELGGRRLMEEAYENAAPMGAYGSADVQEIAASKMRSTKKIQLKNKSENAKSAKEGMADDESNYPQMRDGIQAADFADSGAGYAYVSNDLINQVANNAALNVTRKNFKDVGFWQPNLITDKKGQVNFEIRLPDNITTWKSNVLAMGTLHLHGIDTCEIRAYKPLQVSALVPAFMWKGDQVWAKAKFTNLTQDPKTISARLSWNDGVLKKADYSVKNDVLDSAMIEAKVVGPMQYKATLQFEEKYKDEEQREILVYNPAFRFFSNQTLSMEKDSTYALNFEPGTKGQIILNNSLYEKIVEEINQLNTYEYTCVEQTSSQLKALLCKEKINRVLKSTENLNPRIYKLMRQLENYQNKNGTWGWWKRQPTNWRMTIYAVEALGQAKMSGYNSNGFSKGVGALRENFNSLSVSDRLYAYAVLQTLGLHTSTMKQSLSNIKPEELSSTDKLYYYRSKEIDREKVDFNDLYALYLEMNTTLARPYYGDFFYEPRANLFEAYTLFSKSDLGKEWVELFKRKLLSGQLEGNLNTYAKVALIEALTASTENTDNKPVTAQVRINDTILVKTFPARLPITTDKYRFVHKDATVFVNTSEEKSVDVPRRADSLFKVNTSFVQNGKTIKDLKAGQACQLNVDIEAYKSFDYVMIEIPVPSGLRFINKPQGGDCNIEYYPNKIVVFYQKLYMQQHHLAFDLMPVFKGNFVMPAAKCSLMYYPYVYGNNENQTILIK